MTEKKITTNTSYQKTEARFLHSLKAAQAIALGARVKEIWDNEEPGDQKVVIVQFENCNGSFLIDNSDLQFADYPIELAVEAFQNGEIELSPVEEFRLDPDDPSSLISLSDVASYEFWQSQKKVEDENEEEKNDRSARLSLEKFVAMLDRQSYEGEAKSLHQLEAFSTIAGEASVTLSEGESIVSLSEEDLLNSLKGKDGEISYKLHTFGGADGPIHHITWGFIQEEAQKDEE